MPTGVPDGYITIDEAVQKYGRSRAWWSQQIHDGALTAYDIPGMGRNTFLRLEEIEEHIKPRPRQPQATEDSQAG